MLRRATALKRICDRQRVQNAVLADIGKYSLQLYLLDGYFLGVSRTVLVQVLACTNPLVIVAGNTLFDLAGAFGTAKYVLMKAKVLRVLCGEK